MNDKKSNITIEGHGLNVTLPLKKYIYKIFGSFDRNDMKTNRGSTNIFVSIHRVDRPHGNKYEATIRLTVGGTTYHATDSTLNAYAALDIVRLKLVRELQKAASERLPHGRKRV